MSAAESLPPIAASDAAPSAVWPEQHVIAVLTRFQALAQEGLAKRPDVQAMGLRLGFDAAAQAAWGLGALSPDLRDAFSQQDRDILAVAGIPMQGIAWSNLANATGLVVPTRDPEDPDRVVGFVRIVAGQHKHDWLTAPAGFGGPFASFAAERILLCDGVPAAGAIVGAGVADVLLVESSAVLLPLHAWIAGKRRVLVTNKQVRRQRYIEALGDLAVDTVLVTLPTEPSRIPGTLRTALQVQAAPRKIVDFPIITPDMCRRLAGYGAARLQAGMGMATLAAAGLDVLNLLTIYKAGFLSSGYASALNHIERAVLTGRNFADSLIFPAFDEQGEVVDLAVWKIEGDGGGHWTRFNQEQSGLIAPRVAQAYDALQVFDRVPPLAAYLRSGRQQALLVRGVEDLRSNLPRLHRSGVRRLSLMMVDVPADLLAAGGAIGITMVVEPAAPEQGQAEAVATAHPSATVETVLVSEAGDDVPVVVLDDNQTLDGLTGIEAELPATPAAPLVPSEDQPVTAVTAMPAGAVLELVEHNERLHRATYRFGDCTVVADTPWQGTSLLEVIIRREGQSHRDTFELDEEAQRQRFALAAARRLGLPVAAVVAMLVDLLPRLEALLAGDLGTTATAEAKPVMLAAGAVASLAEATDLVERWCADLDRLGWVGDEQAKILVLLAIVGRVLPQPPWVILHGDPAATTVALAVVVLLLDSALVMTLTRPTEASLLNQGQHGLRDKVVLIESAGHLRADAITLLRVIRARGAVATPASMRDAVTGRMRSFQAETKGPLGVIAAASGAVPLDDLGIAVRLDDSPAQTARVVAAQRARHGHVPDASALAATVAMWQGFFSSVRAQQVVIPFAERISFPAQRVQDRRDAGLFFGLMEASALLHAKRRQRDAHGALVADEADFHLAERAARGVLGVPQEGLPERAQVLLATLKTAGGTAFTIPQLSALLPQMPRTTLRAALNDLVQLDVLGSPDGGRGRRARVFRLLPGGFGSGVSDLPSQARISLLPPGQRVTLPAPTLVPQQQAESGDDHSATISPVAAGG